MKIITLCFGLILSITASAQFGAMPMGSMYSSGGTGASEVTIVRGDQQALSGKRIQVVLVYDSMRIENYCTLKPKSPDAAYNGLVNGRIIRIKDSDSFLYTNIMSCLPTPDTVGACSRTQQELSINS